MYLQSKPKCYEGLELNLDNETVVYILYTTAGDNREELEILSQKKQACGMVVNS